VDKEFAGSRGDPARQAPVPQSPVKSWLKWRQAIEPLVGHTEADHRIDWLLHAISRRGLARLLLALFALASHVGASPPERALAGGCPDTPMTESVD
jgi:hypothetical protein